MQPKLIFARALLALTLALFGAQALAAVTYFGTAGSPADNATQDDVTITITPPASMQAGDVPLVACASEGQNAGYTINNTNAGGQTWTSETVHGNDAVAKTLRLFWVAAFTGTWGTNPQFAPSTTGSFVAFTCRMWVFRGSSTSVTWAIDVAESATSYSAPGSPFDVTTTGQTLTGSSGVVINVDTAIGGLPTWSNQSSGSGWVAPTPAQVRNTYGAHSLAMLYKIYSASGASGNVTNRQSATGYPGWKVIISLKEVGGVTPAFSAGPTLNSASATGYTLGYTPNCTGNSYWVATVKGSGTPTSAQVVAGQNSSGAAAVATANEATTASTPDSIVLGSSLDFPTHDIHGVIRCSSTNSAVNSLTNQVKAAPSGKQYSTFASVASGTFYSSISSPAVAAGDIREVDLVMSPSAVALNPATDGNDSFGSDGSRVYYDGRLYDDSAGGWMSISGGGSTFRVWFNNHAPVAPDFPGGALERVLDQDTAMSIDVCDGWFDAENDVLTATNSSTGTGTGADKRPANTSFGGTGNRTWSGNPNAEGVGTFSAVCTDPPGDSDTLLYSWQVIDTLPVPDCTTAHIDVTACYGLMRGAHIDNGLTLNITGYQYSATVPGGGVISTNPTAGTEVEEYSTVNAVVSLGKAFSGGSTREQRLRRRRSGMHTR